MSVDFEEHCFAQGRFRYAYKGTWIEPQDKKGQKCVVKKKKTHIAWKLTDWDTSLEIREKAQELADNFNFSLEPPFNFSLVSFAALYVHQVVEKDSSSGPKLYEHVLVEDFIPGNYSREMVQQLRIYLGRSQDYSYYDVAMSIGIIKICLSQQQPYF